MYLITQNHVILVNIVNLKLSCLEAWFVEQYIENAEEPCLEKHSDQVMVEGKTVQHLYDTVVGQSGIGAEVCQQQHVAFYHRWSGKPGGKNKKNICLSKLLNTFKAKTIGFKANKGRSLLVFQLLRTMNFFSSRNFWICFLRAKHTWAQNL